MWGKFLPIFMAFGLPSLAHAGGLEPKTMQDPFKTHSIERWLVLGKGWFELEMANDYKLANGFWDADGNAQDFESSSWTYTTQSLNLRYGITRRTELNWKFKTHYVDLQNPDLGTDFQQFGVGDPDNGRRRRRRKARIRLILLEPLLEHTLGDTYRIPRFVG